MTIVNGVPVTAWVPGSLTSQLGFLQGWSENWEANGVTPTFTQIGNNLAASGNDSESPCGVIGLLIGLLTAVIAIITLPGCFTPEPALPVICPALEIINLMLDALTGLILILCGGGGIPGDPNG